MKNYPFVVDTEQVTIDGTYRVGMNEGIVIAMGIAEQYGPAPLVTIGNNEPIYVHWDFNRKIGPCFLDTYTVANICLHSSVPIKVTLFRMFPVEYVWKNDTTRF